MSVDHFRYSGQKRPSEVSFEQRGNKGWLLAVPENRQAERRARVQVLGKKGLNLFKKQEEGLHGLTRKYWGKV